MKTSVRIGTSLLLFAGLAGCASMNSVHWVYPGPGKSRVFSTDAFQRHLIMVEDPADSNKIRACSEASPDAMAVFSASLTGRGIFGPTEREMEAAAAFGQTAATIERTQTINMLREWMFRTCELWLSGALDQDDFLTRSARDHRSMIAILAVEQLTGVVKPPATIISGPAVNAALAHGKEVAELVTAYRKERADAEAAESTAATEFAAANVDHDDGNGGKKKLCAFAAAPDGKQEDYDKCKQAETKAASTKAVADATREREKLVLGQLDTLSAGLAAAVSGGTSNPGGLGRGQNTLTGTELTAIGASVEKIALTAGIDEALMFCVGYLRQIAADPSTRTTCNSVVAASATRDNRMAAEAFAITPSAEVQAAVSAQLSRYEQFRLGMMQLIDGTPDAQWAARWAAFKTRTGQQLQQCEAKLSCRAYFNSGSPFLVAFDLRQADFKVAMDEWESALR